MLRLKQLLTGLAVAGLFFASIPTTMAGSPLEIDSLLAAEATEEVMVEESMIYPCYDCGYYNPGIFFDVSVTTQWEPDRLIYYGNYTTVGDTRGAVAKELNLLFEDAEEQLSPYGTVRRSGMYLYQSWDGSGDYQGDLSVEVQVTELNNAQAVNDIFLDLGFSVWMDAQIEDLVEVESSVTDELKERIDQKEEIYETILGYPLGAITSLSIWTWPNGWTYNTETDLVDVTVSANVGYTTGY